MLNDKDYWDHRFKSGDWEENEGKEQSESFCKLVIENLPKWLKDDIIENSFNICDVGCAEGDGTNVLYNEFKGSEIYGIDFSPNAIQKANDSFPHIYFECQDILKFDKHYDIIFSSNTLEHFKNPNKVFNSLLNLSKKYLILIVPFLEKEPISEHFSSFNYESFPLEMSNHLLVHFEEINPSKYWSEKQILIIYANLDYFNTSNFLLEAFRSQVNQIINTSRSCNISIDSNNETINGLNSKVNSLNSEICDLNSEINGLNGEICDLNGEICDLNGEIGDLNSEISYNYGMIRNIVLNTNNEINAIANTKPYRLAYSLRRFSHEFLKGNWSNRKNFIKWIFNKFYTHRRVQNYSQYNPLFNVINVNNNRVNDYINSKIFPIIDEIISNNDYSFISLFASELGWNMPLFQRPQQISLQLKQLKGLVFHAGGHSHCDNELGDIYEVENNLYVINMGNYFIRDYLLQKLKNIKKPKFVHIYSTDIFTKLDQIEMYKNLGFKIVYEYIDEISEDISGVEVGDEFKKRHDHILKNTDYYVVASAEKLYEDVYNVRGSKNLDLITNGVEYEHWNNILADVPEDMKKIINGKPVIGYFGALASWFDYDLIEKLLLERPEYNIVLIGWIYDESYHKHDLEKYSNFHFLGTKDYKELNGYANNFDVSIIPFLVNDVTESTSPIKLFEYMALNKPIVTTNLPECKKYDSALIGKDHNDFIKKIDIALQMKNDTEYMKLLDKEALENTWESKTKDILELMMIKY